MYNYAAEFTKQRFYHVRLGGIDAVFECFHGHPFDGKPGGAVKTVVIQRKQGRREGTVAEPQRERIVNAVQQTKWTIAILSIE